MYIFNEQGKKLNEFRENVAITVVSGNRHNMAHAVIHQDENGKLFITIKGEGSKNRENIEVRYAPELPDIIKDFIRKQKRLDPTGYNNHALDL